MTIIKANKVNPLFPCHGTSAYFNPDILCGPSESKFQVHHIGVQGVQSLVVLGKIGKGPAIVIRGFLKSAMLLGHKVIPIRIPGFEILPMRDIKIFPLVFIFCREKEKIELRIG